MHMPTHILPSHHAYAHTHPTPHHAYAHTANVHLTPCRFTFHKQCQHAVLRMQSPRRSQRVRSGRNTHYTFHHIYHHIDRDNSRSRKREFHWALAAALTIGSPGAAHGPGKRNKHVVGCNRQGCAGPCLIVRQVPSPLLPLVLRMNQVKEKHFRLQKGVLLGLVVLGLSRLPHHCCPYRLYGPCKGNKRFNRAAYIPKYIHTYIHTCIYTYADTDTYIRTQTHTHTHTYMHTRIDMIDVRTHGMECPKSSQLRDV